MKVWFYFTSKKKKKVFFFKMKEHSTGSSNSFILFLVLATSLLGLFSLWNLTSLSQNQLEQFTLFRSEFRQFYERNNENDVTSSNDKVGLSERLSSTRGPLSDQSEKLQDTQFDSVYNTNAAKKRVEETLSDRRNQVLHKPHLSSSPTSHLPHSRSHKLSGAHLPIVEKPPTTSSLQNRQQQQQHQQQQHRQGSVINLRHEQQHRTSNELAENDQQQQQQQPNWIYKETNHNSGPELMIGVMTARHHFLERQVLRETWVNYIHHNPELSRR